MNGVRRSASLTRVAMMNFDRGGHADMHRFGRRGVEANPHWKALRHDDPVQITADLGKIRPILIG